MEAIKVRKSTVAKYKCSQNTSRAFASFDLVKKQSKDSNGVKKKNSSTSCSCMGSYESANPI